MKVVVQLTDIQTVELIRLHLGAVLGFEGGCRSCRLLAPIRGSRFVLGEATQTCDDDRNRDLDPMDNSLPPGAYEVISYRQPRHWLGSAHWLQLQDLRTEAVLELCFGHADLDCMDWRSLQPYVPPTPSPPPPR